MRSLAQRRRMMFRFGLTAGVLALVAVSGFFNSINGQQASTDSPSSVRPSIADDRYRIGPGDVLEVLVFNQPSLSRPAVRVDGRGMIRLPLLEGEIKAACKTDGELAGELTTRYQEYQKYPQVDVFVKEFNSQPVAVLGAVRAPGRFQLQRRVRLLELLTLSGGPADKAGRVVHIVHGATTTTPCEAQGTSSSADEELSAYRLIETMKGVESANPFLTPGDVVFVPEADLVFVVGNVLKPGGIPLQDQVTVSDAINLAGGVLPNSEKHKVRIIRKPSETAPKTELLVDLQAITKGAEDIVLQANDVVEVPKEGGAKAFFKGFVNTVVPGIMTMPTRIVY